MIHFHREWYMSRCFLLVDLFGICFGMLKTFYCLYSFRTLYLCTSVQNVDFRSHLILVVLLVNFEMFLYWTSCQIYMVLRIDSVLLLDRYIHWIQSVKGCLEWTRRGILYSYGHMLLRSRLNRYRLLYLSGIKFLGVVWWNICNHYNPCQKENQIRLREAHFYKTMIF